MTLPPLDEDVIRLIIQQAAALPRERTRVLLALSLVNSQWKLCAQQELEREVYISSGSLKKVLKAMGRIGRRVKRLEVYQGEEAVWHPSVIRGMVAACPSIEYLRLIETRMLLQDLQEAKDLRELLLVYTTLDAAPSSFTLPFHLTRLVLYHSRLCSDSVVTIRRACKGSLTNLTICSLAHTDAPQVLAALPDLFPSVLLLDVNGFSIFIEDEAAESSDTFLPSLAQCTKLRSLVISTSHLVAALSVLPAKPATPLRLLHVKRPAIVDWSDTVEWEEPLDALLEAFSTGRALVGLERLVLELNKRDFAGDAGGYTSLPLYELKEAAAGRGTKVEIR